LYIYIYIYKHLLLIDAAVPDTAVPEDITAVPEDIYKDKEVYDAFYLLWDLRTESNKTDEMFKQDINRLIPVIKDVPTVLDKSMLSIEIIINQNKDPKDFRDNILSVINWIRKTYSFGCIYIGIYIT
jgi:hypothetical protein